MDMVQIQAWQFTSWLALDSLAPGSLRCMNWEMTKLLGKVVRKISKAILNLVFLWYTDSFVLFFRLHLEVIFLFL